MQPEGTNRVGDESAPNLAEVIGVIRPQIEKIEEGFTAIRVTLDALAEYWAAASAGAAADRRAVDEPRPEPSPELPVQLPPSTAAVPVQPAGDRAPPIAQPVPTTSSPAPTTAPAAAAPAARPQPARAGSIPVSGGGAGDWSRILFGDQLKSHPGLSALSGSLLSEVYDDEADAVGMLGYLLAFRAADQERKPKLLKELGEAFYLWKPAGSAALLEPLIHWVHAALDRAGIGNRIELVQPGDRYDMQRHNAKERGAEVAAVAGWVVLRDNGKVYTKANVSVR